MLIVLDRETKEVLKNLGTNSLYPDGFIPSLINNEDEIFIRLNDNSEFAKRIMTAYDYEIILDENNEMIDVVVNKTLEEYYAELPIEPEPPSDIDELKGELVELKKENILLKAQNEANANRADFHEELIVEMAMRVYE